MKWMIASDLHGSAYYCNAMAELFLQEQASRLILLGDLLYHGPRNELPRDYDPKEVTRILNGMKDRLFCVRGNCDAEVDQMVLEFPILADYMLLALGGRMVFATHGHLCNAEHPPLIGRGDILLHGHTHVQAVEDTGSCIYLNPGSLSLPKEGTKRSYMIYEDGVFTIKDLDGHTIRTLSIR